MRIDYSTEEIDHWFQEYPGKLIYSMEQDQVLYILSHIFGDLLVQIGGASDLSLVKASPIFKKVYLSPTVKSLSSPLQICAQAEELPLYPNSIDVIVLPHLLEYSVHPKIILQEVYQALAPNGQVIIMGFNPLSLWGLKRMFKNQHHFPWTGRFYMVSEINHWLRKLDFRVIMTKTFCFRPPVESEKILNGLLFLEMFGQVCASGFGGVYFIAAQKTVHGLTPIRTHWWSKPLPLSNANG